MSSLNEEIKIVCNPHIADLKKQGITETISGEPDEESSNLIEKAIDNSINELFPIIAQSKQGDKPMDYFLEKITKYFYMELGIIYNPNNL